MTIFEVQTVTHQADLIHFSWNDLGGTYNVYRDGNLLYEGTVPEFGDGDFKHAKMYNYAIERVENGDVVDVIALQTSAYAEQRNVENPLQFLVMTTIVSKNQIVLSWEEMNDIDEYAVYRNGKFLIVVNQNHYTDRSISIDEAYVYTIISVRPLAKSEEELSKSKSVVADVLGRLQKSSTELATVEEFRVTKLIAEPKKLLIPVLEKNDRLNVNRWMFRYTTFIKENWVKNPNALARNHFFKGDGRDFDSEGESYRTRVDIKLAYDKDRTPLTFTKDIGKSVAYSYARKLRKKAVAPLGGIQLKRTDHGREEAGFLLTHAVGNPLVTAPEIDYEVRAVLRRDGTFDMTGYHDQAPHHEVYLSRGAGTDWTPIQLAESKGLAWMSTVTAWQYWRYSNFE